MKFLFFSQLLKCPFWCIVISLFNYSFESTIFGDFPFLAHSEAPATKIFKEFGGLKIENKHKLCYSRDIQKKWWLTFQENRALINQINFSKISIFFIIF